MKIDNSVCVVTGGASGLGAATVHRLAAAGATVVAADIAPPEAAGHNGHRVHYVTADVTSEDDMTRVFDTAEEFGPVRALVHCPGRGLPKRLLNRNHEPFPLHEFQQVTQLNLFGTFNALRLASARMAGNDEVDGERGAIVMTASVAAFEGQIGQIAYTASKAAIVGMTLCAARDLADFRIRVNTIAPGTFDTPLLARLSEDVKSSLAASVPNPPRLGDPTEYADLAATMLTNGYLNGEVVRLDGAIRMAPR
ncbi:SDR family NAD(P)-dependent oxidoreductase [Rhodococcus jostii]|jgi:NAD(P)-dependent dehydrogenase (short-subunit alcohol dehydrogenase family)|uniref:SDR family NAD(P)-dependent oxidoreductase n=1 Tax=Rhodococcus jostii TaxID=132919 RepID=A0ABU4CRZ1_RHOJO|nr:SDR family NAD(P)-dependent oxidoreductase [Rhodococcus jostii]MDV6286314.1 SDR family NAD(P)-dependent oxidoreductase [Rhodococcus jostii]